MNVAVEGKKTLVTGASGFIGSHLCRALSGRGAEVHAVSRFPQPSAESQARWWQADVSDTDAVADLMSTVRPDCVFHLASHVSGARDPSAVLPAFKNNLQTTVNLLTAAANTACQRIVLAGSLEEPDEDDADAVPCSPYAAAKWASSAYARMFHELYGTPVVVARLFMVYGPGQKDLRKLIPYVILSLLRGEAPRLTSGTRPVDWVYVDDVVEGLLRALAPGAIGTSFDVGSGELVTVRDVVERLAGLTGAEVRPVFGDVVDRPMERIRRADLDGTYAKVGWAPTVTLDDGLRRTLEWYRREYSPSAGATAA